MQNIKSIAFSVSVALLIGGCAQPQEVAKTHLAAKNYPAAIEAFRQANTEEPNNGAHLKGLGDAYFGNGQYAEAIETYLKAKALGPYTQTNSCNLGSAYYYLGRYDEALGVFQNADVGSFSTDIKNTRMRALRGGGAPVSSCAQIAETVFEKAGRYDLLIAGVQKQIDSDPRQGEPFMKIAALYVKNGQYDEAIAASKRAIDLMPASADTYHTLGIAYWKKKEYKDAVGSLRRASELNPKNSVTTVFLAKSYEQVGETAKAIDVLRKAPQIDAYSMSIDYELGRLLYQTGDYLHAVESADAAVRKSAINGVGVTIETIGNNTIVRGVTENSPAAKNGIRIGDRITQVDGMTIAGWNVQQVTEKIRGQPDTTVRLILERATETLQKQLVRETFFTSEAAPMFALRSMIGRKLGKTEQSQQDAQKAYALKPKEGVLAMAAVAYDRGDMAGVLRHASVSQDTYAKIFETVVYARGGNTSKALELLREIGITNTNAGTPFLQERSEVLKSLSAIRAERYQKGVALEQSNQALEAANAYSDALVLSPSEEEARPIRAALFKLATNSALQLDEESHRHVVRAQFYASEGKLEASLSEFKKALSLAPFAARLYYNSALVEAKLERYSDALKDMRLYLEALPGAQDERSVKDEMIKWEMYMEKPRDYPCYEPNPDTAVSNDQTPSPAPSGGRGGMIQGR
ncbi:tetratricopeptide repeat protein [Sulfuricurvum sp.]|uniref:tetratricopeptide repeat protein n=1 Tax=Sulfuricurvum sp. TaxID=2025608 RepID=UPI002E307475|nr:tetratricopeptide repeat protein [Sulfuricurvum sp.]HEX5328732.1 tetratricopeptide repeat protein [Sulfuricurvum sp.]